MTRGRAYWLIYRTAIVLWLAIAVYWLLSCGGGGGVTAPATPEVSMSASAWSFRYSPGMPEHPVPALGGGWQFDFPAADGVHYLTTPLTADLTGRSITVRYEIVGSEPVWSWPADSCYYAAAKARLMVQRQGDDMQSASGRWWADTPIALRVGAASITVQVDPVRWSNVDGITGLGDAAGFADAMAHPGWIGLTFAGGCSYGHGAWLAAGTARMIVTEMGVL